MSNTSISLSSSVPPFLLFNPVVLALRHWALPSRPGACPRGLGSGLTLSRAATHRLRCVLQHGCRPRGGFLASQP